MGNIIRIVAGLAGLAGAAWAGSRALRHRQAGEDGSLAPAFAIAGVAAIVIALTLLL